MKYLLSSFTFLLIFSLVAPPLFAQHIWSIQEGYSIQFDGSGASGTFKGLEGRIKFDPQNPSMAQFNVSVETQTISTGNKTKDKHARNENWFHAEAYPSIAFKSSSVKKEGSSFVVTGNLSMKGITKEISIPFEFSSKGNTGTFKGKFTVNRKDYDIMGPFMAFMVGDDFEIIIEVPVMKQAP